MRLFGLEIRQAGDDAGPVSATDVAADQIAARARGDGVEASQLFAVELAAATWARTFAAADLSGDGAALVTPSVMTMIARSLAIYGEIAFVVRGMNLIPAHSITVQGDADPATWTYRLTLPGPTDSQTAVYPQSQILHFRIGTDPQRPWRGQSPLVAARAGAATASGLEKSLQGSFRVQRLNILALGTRLNPSQLDQVMAGVRNRATQKDGLVVLANDGGINVSAVSPDVATGQGELRRAISAEILAAYGLSAVLLNEQAPATSLREVARMLLNGTIQPIAKLIAAEVMAKTGTEIIFDFAKLRASDVAGQARAVGALVKAGVSVSDALVQTGLEDPAS